MELQILSDVKSLMYGERNARQDIVVKGIKMYGHIVGDFYDACHKKYVRIRHRSITDYYWYPIYKEYYPRDEKRNKILPLTTIHDIAHILKLFVRDYLCHFLCIDIVNVILSFFNYSVKPNAVRKRNRKLLT